MNHLTYDQCKNLKEWGLAQDTEYDIGEGSLRAHGTSEFWVSLNNPIACPGLEELLEWLGRPYELYHYPNDTYCAVVFDENKDGSVQTLKGHSRSLMLRAVYALAEALHQPKD